MKVGLLMEKKKVLGYGDLVEENFFKECLKEIKFMGKAFFKVIQGEKLLENGKIIKLLMLLIKKNYDLF